MDGEKGRVPPTCPRRCPTRRRAHPRHARVTLLHYLTGGADGKLEGHELINLQLGAELVVLSACETARGRINTGEGVVGLSWALFAAGASTAA